MRTTHASRHKLILILILQLTLAFVCPERVIAADEEGELFVDDALPAETPSPALPQNPPPSSPASEIPSVPQSSPPTQKIFSVAEDGFEDWEVSAEEDGMGYVVPPPERKDVGLDGITRKSTESFVKRYLTASGRAWIALALYESIPYRPYIREQLEVRGMPMFLQYLPIVESNYRPRAVSPSGAVGLWQFMANSMHPYLKKTEYVDERLDPWKETDAALSKLAENYTVFGDWKLALAAYNMGGGALRRLLKAHPGKDYWYFAENGFLSKQAAEYIPKLIAITDIIENAEYYGAIEVAASDKRIEGVKSEKFSYLNVTGVIRLSTVAEACDLPVEVLQELNIELLKGHTPPGSVYRLRLPRGMANIAAKNLNARKKPNDAAAPQNAAQPQESSTSSGADTPQSDVLPADNASPQSTASPQDASELPRQGSLQQDTAAPSDVLIPPSDTSTLQQPAAPATDTTVAP